MRRKAFISYSHDDINIVDVFIKESTNHLKDVGIDIWFDKNIELGEKWHQKIQNELKQSDLIIMLISTNFLNSKYIQEYEYKVALNYEEKYNIKVIPILLSNCNFSKFSDLSEKQIFMPMKKDYTDIKEKKSLSFQNLLKFDNFNNAIPCSNRNQYLLDFAAKINEIKFKKKEISTEDNFTEIIEKKERTIEKIIDSLVEKKDWNLKQKFEKVSDWEERIIFELYLISQGSFADDIYFLYLHENSTQKKTYDYLITHNIYNKLLKLYILTEKPDEKNVLNPKNRIENIKNSFNAKDVYFIEDFCYTHLFEDFFKSDFFDYKEFDISNFVESFSVEDTKDKTALKILNEWYDRQNDPILVVKGYGGVGKSTLVKYFLDSIKNTNVAKLYIESKDIINEIIKISERNEIIDDIFYFYEAAAFKKSVQKILTQKLFEISVDNGNLLIVLDGIDEIIARLGVRFDISSFLNSIFSNYSNNSEKCKIIITCRDYFWDKLNIGVRNIHLKPFNEILANEFFIKSFGKLTSQIGKAMKLANKFAIKRANDEDIYIPYILDTIVYIINKKLSEDDEFDKLELDSDYLNPEIANDYLIGSICDREIHKLGNMNSIDKQIDFFINLAIEYNGTIIIDDLLKIDNSLISIIENLKSHTILNTDNKRIFFRYDFFNEYFKGLGITIYFKDKPNTIDEKVLNTMVNYINYDTNLFENILERISFDDELKLFCLENIEKIIKEEKKIQIKRKQISSILIFLMILLKKQQKITSENCTDLITTLFENNSSNEIENLCIVNLYTNDTIKPVFNFKDKVFRNCYFENYEYFWESNMSDNTKFIESTFKSLTPKKDNISITIKREQFINCNTIEIEELLKESKKVEKEKRKSIRDDLELLFRQFYKNGNFYPYEVDVLKRRGLEKYAKILVDSNILDLYINPKKPNIGKQYKVNNNYNNISKIFTQGNNSIEFDKVVKIVEKSMI
jgi:hypothetical protein